MLGNVVDAGALHQALEHRELALGQQRMGRPRIGQPDLEDHAVGQFRIDIAPTSGDLANRQQQQGRVAVLSGVTGGTDFQGARGHLRLIMHGQHQDGRRIVQRANPRNRLQAIHPRHRDIQQHHIARQVAQGLQQLLAVAGLTHHLQVLGQADELLDALADDGVVFRHQYSNHAAASIFIPGLFQGDAHAEGGALAQATVQVQLTAEHQHPLAHADQTKGAGPARGGDKTAAIVADGQAQPAGVQG